MKFDMFNETDVNVLSNMIKTFQEKEVEYLVKRITIYEIGKPKNTNRTNVELIVLGQYE